MDQITQQRMFEPFFGTKFTGRGLGLAATRGIVRAHNGAIFVDSARNKGTVIRIYLPVSEDNTKASSAIQQQTRTVVSKPVVLIVDDEVEVCDVAAKILERAGFRAIKAYDGQSGVEAFARAQHELSLVLLDLALPKLTGSEVFAQMRALSPVVKIIITSGYDEKEAKNRYRELSSSGYLQKPFNRATLLAAVRSTLAF